MSREKKSKIDLRHELKFKRNLNQLDIHYKKIIELEEEIRFHRAEIDKLVGLNQSEKFGESTDELMLIKRFEQMERHLKKLDARINSLRPISSGHSSAGAGTTSQKYNKVETTQREDFIDDREILVRKLREQIEASVNLKDSEESSESDESEKYNSRARSKRGTKQAQKIITHQSDDSSSDDEEIVYEGTNQKYSMD